MGLGPPQTPPNLLVKTNRAIHHHLANFVLGGLRKRGVSHVPISHFCSWRSRVRIGMDTSGQNRVG